MTQTRTAEFDSFGPWAMVVTTPDQVPPLFRPATDLTNVRFAVKIPRDIERRNANPRMNLYDTFILVQDQQLTVLSRVLGSESTWDRKVIVANDLLAIEDSDELLDGQLRLHVRNEKPVFIHYNGVSTDVIQALVDQIRSCWRHPGPVAEAASRSATGADMEIDRVLGPRDIWLVNHYRNLRQREPQLNLLEVRPSRVVQVRQDAPLLVKLRHSRRPPTLHAAIVAQTDSELILLHHRSWLDSDRYTDCSFATTVVPLGRNIQLEAKDHPYWQGIRSVRLYPTLIAPLVANSDGFEAAIESLLGRS
jgi:hypothetical protein